MDANQARALIDALDLGYEIQEVSNGSHWGLTEQQAEEAAKCYRKFLFVCWYAANSNEGVRMAVVCECADAIWHEHILVTRKYREDCAAIFGPGSYLDHVPTDYDGVTGVTEADRNAALALYQAAGVTPCDHPRAECVWCQTR